MVRLKKQDSNVFQMKCRNIAGSNWQLSCGQLQWEWKAENYSEEAHF